jgi:hypothetical protein
MCTWPVFCHTIEGAAQLPQGSISDDYGPDGAAGGCTSPLPPPGSKIHSGLLQYNYKGRMEQLANGPRSNSSKSRLPVIDSQQADFKLTTM